MAPLSLVGNSSKVRIVSLDLDHDSKSQLQNVGVSVGSVFEVLSKMRDGSAVICNNTTKVALNSEVSGRIGVEEVGSC